MSPNAKESKLGKDVKLKYWSVPFRLLLVRSISVTLPNWLQTIPIQWQQLLYIWEELVEGEVELWEGSKFHEGRREWLVGLWRLFFHFRRASVSLVVAVEGQGNTDRRMMMMMKTEKKWSGRTRRLLEIIDMFSKGAMTTNLGGLDLILLYVAGLNSLLLQVVLFWNNN